VIKLAIPLIQKLIRGVKYVALYQVKWPSGLATMGIFCISLVSYWIMSPYFGDLNVPNIVLADPGYPPSFLLLLKQSILGTFWHGDLSHIMRNYAFTVPCMLIIEKKLGPLSMIMCFLMCGILGGLCQWYMIGGPGIGSSTATFGLIPVAVFLLTEGFARWIIFPVMIVMAIEAAKWWIMDGVGHVAHWGGMAYGVMYVFAIAVNPNTEDID